MLFRGDIVLELVLSDVVELQPEIMMQSKDDILENKMNMRMILLAKTNPLNNYFRNLV